MKNEITNFPKTKIVATLGPSVREVSVLEELLKAGMNVARLNFSHGDHAEHKAAIANVRKASKATGLPVALLQDLGGPKIRIGNFSTETVTLVAGQKFTLTTEKIIGDEKRVFVNYHPLPKEVKKGDTIMINDGKLQLTVVRTNLTDVVCEVVIGGTIRGRRGVNVPGANLSISAITAKDKKDLVFGLSEGVDFVTLSFVRRAEEVRQLRKLIKKQGSTAGIIAKIETKEAVENIDEIISEADGIMVARGDLAIEVPRALVPLIQKRIIYKCNQLGKPVITATQMLDSMREQAVPTRAEVNDVANAIIDGTDAVMLSDETTIGKYPVQAVLTMAQIAHTVEENKSIEVWSHPVEFFNSTSDEAITAAIAKEASGVKAKAIVVLTETGRTAKLVARHRPQEKIVVLTPHQTTFNQLLLVHGCYPVLASSVKNLTEALKLARQELIALRIGKVGDTFVLGAGMSFGNKGATNLLVIEKI